MKDPNAKIKESEYKKRIRKCESEIAKVILTHFPMIEEDAAQHIAWCTPIRDALNLTDQEPYYGDPY